MAVSRIYSVVRLLRTILTLLLAVAWLPLTAHCQLENLTGSELFHCQSVDGTTPAGDSHCNDTSCCDWESGHCLVPATPLSAPISFQTVVLPLPWLVLQPEAPAPCFSDTLTASPPGPPRPWHFFVRAALPVRAPSFLS